MSITNGVEEVLDRLNQNGWLDENPQLFYRDTEGQIDKINYAFGMSRDKIKFLGFDFGGWE
jgi:hypothetical protein